MLLVPLAGYVYSGSVAARAYRLLEVTTDEIQRVVEFTPHRGEQMPPSHA